MLFRSVRTGRVRHSHNGKPRFNSVTFQARKWTRSSKKEIPMLFPVPPAMPSNLTSPSLVLSSAMPSKVEKEVATKAQFKKWGEETLQRLFTEFRSDRPGLYSDERSSENPKKSSPAFMWGCGVMLSALTAATKEEPKAYKPRLEPFISGLEVYWNNAGDVGGDRKSVV